MRTFDQSHKDCRQAGFPCAYWGERGNWFTILGQSRDSEVLERSNFEVAQQWLEESQADSDELDAWAVESESHFLVGWVDTLLVNPLSIRALMIADRIRESLESYPILCESHYSQTESDEEAESWESWGRREYQSELVKSLESRNYHVCAGAVDDLADDQIDELAESARQSACESYPGASELVELTTDSELRRIILANR